MGPRHSFTRVPLQVGSELRITAKGEIRLANPPAELEPALDAADAVLDYRFDEQSGEHVIRLVEPVALRSSRPR
jgi:hypothetical protein